MNEMVVTMFVAATDTEPAYTKVVRVEFDTPEAMGIAANVLFSAQGVTNAEFLHA
jgi:hypothetical protein